MARPRKNNADYFSHDNCMRKDTKIESVRSKYGNEGYAFWCMLLEVLSECDNFKLKLKSDIDWELLAGDFRVEVEKLKEIIGFFVKIRLVVWDRTNLVCPNLIQRLSPLLEERERKRVWREEQENRVKDGTNPVKDGTNPVKDGTNPQSKVKERKDTIVEATKDCSLVESDIGKVPPFDASEYIEKLKQSPQFHIQLVGKYMKSRGMDKKGVLPSKKAAETEMKRHLKAAVQLAEYPIERIRKATLRAMKITKEWTLETTLKQINKN